MPYKILKIGRTGIAALITLISIIASVAFTIVTMEIFDREFDPVVISISIVAPAIIAPCVFWHIIGLMIKIHQLEEEARALATYDMLTGLMTRRAFLTNCESVYKLIRRNKSLLSLAYIDIDNFKKINDTHGHAGGDEVLKSFGSGVYKYLRKSDIVGRIGGEEFALALPDTDLESAIHVLDKIRLSVKNTRVIFSDQTIHYTVSIGVALFDQKNQVDLEQLARQSDNALYKAKNSGKDCIVEYKANKAN